MKNSGSVNQVPQKRRTSIKGIVIVFSAILFMSANGETGTENELVKTVKAGRTRLEASVNGEIALALKMADSPLIKRHFQNPGDRALRELAFEEFEGFRRAFSGDTVFWVSDADKLFYMDAYTHYWIDTDDPMNYWYNLTLYQTEKFNYNINYNAELQIIMLWINVPVFDSGRRPIGIVGTGIDLSGFLNDIYRNYSGGADLYFFNSWGEITGARDLSLIANKTTLDRHLGNTGEEILARVNELKPGETQYFTASGGGEVALGEVPALEWYITAVLPVNARSSIQMKSEE
jgi:methyl-accepting chemotaxis protein